MNAQKTQGSSVGNDVYGGLATYGKINVIIGTVISSVIVLALLIFGSKLYFSKDKQTKLVQGTATNVSVSTSNNTTSTTSTTYTIHYSVDSKQYAIQGSGNGVINGQTINVLYDPENPSSARMASSMSNHTLGGILISVGLVVGLLSGLTLYFTLKYKEFAAIEGGITVGSQIGNLIRG
jgi:hypothetical protein